MIRRALAWTRALAGPPGLPAHVTLFVTGRCTFRCRHCFYAHHLNEPGEELRLEELQRLARGFRRALWVQVAGGEPFLREDVAECLEVVRDGAPLAFVSIVTSGLDPVRLEATVERALRREPGRALGVSVSLDGVGTLHDEIRGVQGSFARACESLERLSRLQTAHPSLRVFVPTCYSALNQTRIEEIPLFLAAHFPEVAWDFALVRGLPRDPSSADALNIERYLGLKRRFCDGHGRGSLGRLIAAKDRALVAHQERWLRAGDPGLRCRAADLSVLVREHGELVSCETREFPIANLRDHDMDLAAALSSREAAAVRARIREAQCHCGHECNLTTNLLFSPWRVIMLRPAALRATR